MTKNKRMNNKTGIRGKQEDTVVNVVVTGFTYGKCCWSLKTVAFLLSLSMFQVILFQMFALNKNSCFIFCISDLSRWHFVNSLSQLISSLLLFSSYCFDLYLVICLQYLQHSPIFADNKLVILYTLLKF